MVEIEHRYNGGLLGWLMDVLDSGQSVGQTTAYVSGIEDLQYKLIGN